MAYVACACQINKRIFASSLLLNVENVIRANKVKHHNSNTVNMIWRPQSCFYGNIIKFSSSVIFSTIISDISEKKIIL